MIAVAIFGSLFMAASLCVVCRVIASRVKRRWPDEDGTDYPDGWK